MRALIVEDEAVTARDLADILRHWGYGVAGVAASYERAIEIVENEKPDLALLDINLRGGRSGLQIAGWIREFSNLPIVFLTSRTDGPAIAEARALRANGYLVKPFAEEGVFAAIETALGNFEDASDSPPAQGAARGGLAPYVQRRLAAYIAERYAEPISIAQLAEMAGLSRFHLAAAFRRSFGEPPHRYLIARRMETARRLLIETDQPIAAIAEAVGYQQQTHFSSIFRRTVGMPPSQYRREHAQG